MKRREFITLLGSAATWPLAARAQQPSGMRRIGVLVGNAESDAQTQVGLAKFSKALQDLGWIVGHNITIDYRWAAADLERMTTFAKELVALKPDLIVASTTPVVEALRRETNTIPIVFVVVADPVGSGFVNSLPRPGGSITGFINVELSLSGKWVELLKEVVPHLSRAALLFNPECIRPRSKCRSICAQEPSDRYLARLLRASRKRPSERRATERRYELPSSDAYCNSPRSNGIIPDAICRRISRTDRQVWT